MSSFERLPDYYRELGIDRGASQEDVKKAFQTLAKELHPDANPSTASAARFQSAKEAYDVLKNEPKRRLYDAQLTGRYGAPTDPYEVERLRRRAEEFNRNFRPHGGSSGQTRAMRMVEQLLRPKFVMAVPFIAAASWWLTSTYSDVQYAPATDTVPAWFNPLTTRWETPAPWDPLYHANVHTTKNVGRRHVYPSQPPGPGAPPAQGQRLNGSFAQQQPVR